MAETITVRGDGITLELLLHRKYGLRGRSLVEDALVLNPGLAGLGAFLPKGTPVIIPDLPPETATVRKVVTLFG